MQAALKSSIPAPADDDEDGVCWALSTATSLWQIEQREEALKWLRRAADAAREAGRAERATELLGVVGRLLDEAPPTTKTPGSTPAPRADAARVDGDQKTMVRVCAASPRPTRLPPPPLPPRRPPPVRAIPGPRELMSRSSAPPPPTKIHNQPSISAHSAMRVAVRVVGGKPSVEPLPRDRAAPPGSFAAVLVPLDASDADLLLAWHRAFPRTG